MYTDIHIVSANPSTADEVLEAMISPPLAGWFDRKAFIRSPTKCVLTLGIIVEEVLVRWTTCGQGGLK